MVHLRSYGNRRRRLFRFIKHRNQKLVRFYFVHRYSLLRTLLPLPRRFYGINAASSSWTWVALSTVYSLTSRRFDLHSLPPCSRRINLGYWFANDFIWMGRRHHYKFAEYQTDFGWVYLWCGSCRWREIFREKCLSALREWVISPATGPQESKNKLVEHWQYWKKYSPDFFPVSTIKEEYFNEKMSSLVGLKIKLFNFAQKYWFWPFLTTWVHLQSRFSQRTDKKSKNFPSVSWERSLGTLC